MLNVGCQPPWRRFSVEGLPLCDNSNLLTQFGNEYGRIITMVKNELIEETKCLAPCTFMEYKVDITICSGCPVCLVLKQGAGNQLFLGVS